MAKFTREYEFNCPYCGHSKIVKNGRQANSAIAARTAGVTRKGTRR